MRLNNGDSTQWSQDRSRVVEDLVTPISRVGQFSAVMCKMDGVLHLTDTQPPMPSWDRYPRNTVWLLFVLRYLAIPSEPVRVGLRFKSRFSRVTINSPELCHGVISFIPITPLIYQLDPDAGSVTHLGSSLDYSYRCTNRCVSSWSSGSKSISPVQFARRFHQLQFPSQRLSQCMALQNILRNTWNIIKCNNI